MTVRRRGRVVMPPEGNEDEKGQFHHVWEIRAFKWSAHDRLSFKVFPIDPRLPGANTGNLV